MKTINEDRGSSWASHMIKGYRTSMTDENDTDFSAWIATENRKRLMLKDHVLINGPEGFIRDTLEWFEKNAPDIYRRNRQSIERMVTDYVNKRQEQTVQRQVNEDIERIFSY